MNKVSQGELSKLFRIAAPKVHKLVSNGSLELDADGQIDLDAAQTVLALTGLREPEPETARDCEPPEADDDASPMPTSYQRARAIKEHYAAQRERLKYEREKRAADLQAQASQKRCPHCGKPI